MQQAVETVLLTTAQLRELANSLWGTDRNPYEVVRQRLRVVIDRATVAAMEELTGVRRCAKCDMWNRPGELDAERSAGGLPTCWQCAEFERKILACDVRCRGCTRPWRAADLDPRGLCIFCREDDDAPAGRECDQCGEAIRPGGQAAHAARCRLRNEACLICGALTPAMDMDDGVCLDCQETEADEGLG